MGKIKDCLYQQAVIPVHVENRSFTIPSLSCMVPKIGKSTEETLKKCPEVGRTGHFGNYLIA